eukprot:s29_g75.t1
MWRPCFWGNYINSSQVLDSPDVKEKIAELQPIIDLDSPKRDSPERGVTLRRWKSNVLRPPAGSVVEVPLLEEVDKSEIRENLKKYWHAWNTQSWTCRRGVFEHALPEWADLLFRSFKWTDEFVDAWLEALDLEDVQPDTVELCSSSSLEPAELNAASSSSRPHRSRSPFLGPRLQPAWPRGVFEGAFTSRRPVTRSRTEHCLTREDSGWCSGVASYSQETPEEDDADHTAEPPPPASLRVRLDQICKWGRCPFSECKHSMRPHLLRSGTRAGELTLFCSRWWVSEHGKRACWGQRPFDQNRFSELPRFLQNEYRSIANSLRRNGRP